MANQNQNQNDRNRQGQQNQQGGQRQQGGDMDRDIERNREQRQGEKRGEQRRSLILWGPAKCRASFLPRRCAIRGRPAWRRSGNGR
jgi:hypothetical protein